MSEQRGSPYRCTRSDCPVEMHEHRLVVDTNGCPACAPLEVKGQK